MSIGDFFLAEQWPPEEEFWDRLQRMRRKRKVPNGAIAKVAGVVRGTVSNWKAGQKPETLALLSLARFFGVSPEWLLTGKEIGEGRSGLPLEEEQKTPLGAARTPKKRKRARG